MEKSGMIRLPNISAGTEAEQLRQIRSYLSVSYTHLRAHET